MKRLLTVLLLLSAASAPGQDRPARLEHEQVAVSLRTTSSDPSARAEVTSTGDTLLSVGERSSVVVAVTSGLCCALSGGGKEQSLARLEPSSFIEHLWWADVELLDGGLEDLRLAIDWQRLDRRDGELVRTNGGTKVLSLGEGDRHLLDFIGEPSRDGSQICYDNVLVDITAAVREDPELEDEQLDYDLWLVVEDPAGKRKTARVAVSGKQGERVKFDFASLRWLIAEDVLPGGLDAEQAVDFSGSVRGRLRRDGSITVDLAATRWFGVAPAGGPRRGGIGDAGQKVFTVTPDETVRMPLPERSAGGSHGESRAPGSGGRLVVPPDRGVSLDDNAITSHQDRFFAGYTMSLLLTVEVSR